MKKEYSNKMNYNVEKGASENKVKQRMEKKKQANTYTSTTRQFSLYLIWKMSK